MRRRPYLALLATALCACNTGDVHGLADVEGALAYIAAQVPMDSFQGDHLRVGLLWAAPSEVDRYCIERAGIPGIPGADLVDSEVAAHGCRDPFGVVPGLVDVSVALGGSATGSVRLPLDHLPTGKVLVGTLESRIAYGTVVVFDDRNDNGTLDLRGPRFPRGGRGGRDRGDGPHREGDDEPRAQGDEEEPPQQEEGKEGPEDRVLGSSFTSMLQPQARIAFREGAFNEASFFYPAMGCEAPPKGFSVMHVEGLPTAATCRGESLDEAIVEIGPGDEDALRWLACQPRWGRGTAGLRPDKEPDPRWPRECLGPDKLVTVDPKASCPAVVHYELSGSEDDGGCDDDEEECEKGAWDMHDAPPPWWPCSDEEPIP